MNIIVINHYAGGPKFGMEFRPYYLAKEWMKAGHRVLIVAASFSHLRAKQPTLGSSLKREVIEGVEYVWIRTNSYKGNGLGRIFSIFSFTLRLYYKLHDICKEFHPDLIIASSTYPLDNFPVVYLSQKYKAKSCYEVHDLWPLSPMELGGYSKYHPFIFIMQMAENFAYKKVDAVVSMLPNTLAHMVSHGLEPGKFCHIPNGIAIDEWEEHPNSHEYKELLGKFRANGKTIVGYLGGHAVSNALDTLIEAAALVKKDNLPLVFVLVGDGAEKQRLVHKSENLLLDNVFFLPPIPKHKVPALLADMDVLYLGWHDSPLYRFGISPNKLMDYMMAAKPIIHSVRAANDLVAESGCGISVPPDQPSMIVKAVKQILNMSQDDQIEMGKKGKKFVRAKHNYSVLSNQFIAFVES